MTDAKPRIGFIGLGLMGTGFTTRLLELGYTVTINDPFKGVELVEKYSNPARGYHSIQIEINKSLYMNEKTNEKNANYDRLKSHIADITAFIADYIESRLTQLAAD